MPLATGKLQTLKIAKSEWNSQGPITPYPFPKNLHLVWSSHTRGVIGPAQVSVNISGDEFLYLCPIYEEAHRDNCRFYFLLVPMWTVGTIDDMMTSMSSEGIVHKGRNMSAGLLEAEFCVGFCLLHLPAVGIRGNPHKQNCFNRGPGGFSYGYLSLFEGLAHVKRLLVYVFGL